jgi:deazaflavin-dependent oxidoreductase (nitroreductase family)
VQNFLVHPEVDLQDGAERHTYRARLTEGVERAEWWDRAVQQYAPFAEYQEKTDRAIPLFLLERV